MLINELSKRTGLPVHTLRYYENYGLFEGVTDVKVTTNNYKNYDESSIGKIEIIKGAKEVGFTLIEIRDLLNNWYNNKISIKKKIKIVNDKIDQIDAKIIQFNNVKNVLLNAITVIENGDC